MAILVALPFFIGQRRHSLVSNLSKTDMKKETDFFKDASRSELLGKGSSTEVSGKGALTSNKDAPHSDQSDK